MTKVRITRQEIEAYKREVLQSSVLVKLEEAAVVLAVHPRTVLRRVEEGRLIAYNDNQSHKGIRFLASELQSYVREMRQELREE